MRHLNKVIIHCSATREGAHYDVDTIRKWHLERKFKDIGYHYLIYIDGTIVAGRGLDLSGAHTKGHNKDSIGICYIGGLDKNNKPKDTMNEKQELSLLELIYSIRTLFGNLTIHGHNEYSNKACPSFKVSEKYQFLN